MESQNIQSISLLITISIVSTALLVVALVLFIIVYQRKSYLKNALIKQKEQEKTIELLLLQLTAEENTKTKIANNLHDEINPNLSLLIKQLGRLKTKNPENVTLIDSQLKLLENTIQSLTSTVYDLAPKHLKKFGLIASVQDYLTTISQTKEIKTNFSNQLPEQDLQLKSESDILQTYRLIMELINNVIKHAKCNSIAILFSQHNQQYLIEIQHNGVQVSNEDVFHWQENALGLGLKSIASRCLLIGATVNYIPNINLQKIIITIPSIKNE